MRARLWMTQLAGGLLVTLLLAPASATAAVALPSGFSLRTALKDLAQPTAVRFAPGGLVFVAEKRGTVQVFDGLGDATPSEVVNLRREVFNDGDRGLLGLEVDPDFTSGRPYLYALYTRDARLSVPGEAAPAWGPQSGSPDAVDTDYCAGLYTTGCEVSGRLVRITVDPATGARVGDPVTLLDGWCQQFSTHTVGDLRFGSGRRLYLSGGDGAGYDSPDVGQLGNPCPGDPPGEGGALRAQDLLHAGDPVGLSGALLRIDPDPAAGAPGVPGNPLFGAPGADADAQRIVGYGFRNPYRFALRPGAAADDLFVGDVGWGRWEEIDRVHPPFTAPSPFAGPGNYGWPCYEGDWDGGAPNRPYSDGPAQAFCAEASLPYAQVTNPFFAYYHTKVEGQCFPTQFRQNYNQTGVDPTPFSSGSITGLAFYDGTGYPAAYDGGLFFGDYSRGCLWFMGATAGEPDPSKVSQFALWDASNPYSPDLGLVGIERGPGGDIFLVDISGGRIRRLTYGAAAALTVTPAAAPAAQPRTFSAAGSTPPPGTTIAQYEWDFDGDGTYDRTTATPSTTYTYATKGVYQARVLLTYANADTDVSDAQTVSVDPPTDVALAAPADPAAVRWAVGDRIPLAASAKTGDSGVPIPGAQLSWSVVVRHCGDDGDCHSHAADSQLSGFGPGNTGASGMLAAPDHGYPSHLELRVTAHDPSIPALTTTTIARLDPATVTIGLYSEPAGIPVTLNDRAGPSPLLGTVIKGSANGVGAVGSATVGGGAYAFDGWSDGGARAHDLTAATDTTLTARYAAIAGAPAATVAPPSPAAAKAPSAAAVKRAALPRIRRVAARRATRSGQVRLGVRCAGRRRCRATLRLETDAASAKRRVRLGGVTVLRLRPSSRRTVRLRLSARARRLLALRRKLTVRATITVTPAGGRRVTTRTRFTLLAPRR